MHLIEAERDAAQRSRLEAFIAARYVDCFGAPPPLFAPRLIALATRDDRIVAACGLRAAADGFFSEPYVDGPIEVAAGRLLGHDLERNHLFEITTMAAVSATGIRGVVAAAVEFGRRLDCRASLFTATAELRQLLDRHDIVTRKLAPAVPERLANADAWGRYYEHDPWVCVADQPPFATAIRRVRGVHQEARANA